MSEVITAEFEPVNLDQHTVTDLAMYCSDFRFGKAFEATLQNREVDDKDMIVWPGPSAAVVDGPVLPALETLHGLHGFSRVRIQDHLYCGAMKLAGEYDDSATEQEMLEVTLNKQDVAVSFVHEKLPELVVVTCVVGPERVLSERQHRV